MLLKRKISFPKTAAHEFFLERNLRLLPSPAPDKHPNSATRNRLHVAALPKDLPCLLQNIGPSCRGKPKPWHEYLLKAWVIKPSLPLPLQSSWHQTRKDARESTGVLGDGRMTAANIFPKMHWEHSITLCIPAHSTFLTGFISTQHSFMLKSLLLIT